MKTFQTSSVFFLTLALSLGGGLGGCSGAKKKDYASKSPKESPQQKKSEQPTPWRQTLGRVALVNADMSFVLIEIGTAPAPEPGAPLLSYSGDMVSAELVVSNYQKRPFLIGDILSGMPKVGDSIVLVSAPPSADDRPSSRQEPTPRSVTAMPLPKVDSRTRFLPSLSNEGPEVISPRVRQGAETESAAPVLTSEPISAPSVSVPPPPRMVPSQAPSSKGDSSNDASSSGGAEIIPGIPTLRKR